MPIEIESPEEYGYDKIKYKLSESSISDQTLESLHLQFPDLTLLYNEHRGETQLRNLIAEDAGVTADDVLITSGAARALFIIATSQLDAPTRQGPAILSLSAQTMPPTWRHPRPWGARSPTST